MSSTPSTQKESRPHVGVGVIVMKDGKVLMQHRVGSHGAGTWSFPGGHLEFGEDPEACAEREALEELGVKLTNLRRGPYTNDVHEKDGRHGITLFILADWESGEPEIREPQTTSEWRWCSWDAMPQPLFLPIVNLQKQNFNPFDRRNASLQSG